MIRNSISLQQLGFFAYRNFIRHKVRNVILIIVISAGLLMYVFFNSFLLGIREGNVKSVIKYETGAAQIMTPQYFDSNRNPIEQSFVFTPSFEQSLQSLGWKSSPLLQTQATLNLQSPPYPTDGTVYLSLLALDLDRDQYMQDVFEDSIVEFDDTKLHRDSLIRGVLADEGIIISKWLADRISAEVGYPITLVTKGRGGFVEQLDLEVSGIFETFDARIDRTTAIISYETADDYLYLDGHYTVINLVRDLNVPNPTLLARDVASVNNALVDLGEHTKVRAYGWEEVEIQRYDAIAWNYPSGMAFLYTFFIFIIATTGIVNSIVMNIKSRKKEIGTLQAFGLKRKEVMLLYLLEMLFIGILTIVLTIILGIVIMALLVYVGIDYSFFMEETTFGMVNAGVFYGSWDMKVFITTSIIAILFPVGVGFLSILRMRKQYTHVIELLRART